MNWPRLEMEQFRTPLLINYELKYGKILSFVPTVSFKINYIIHSVGLNSFDEGCVCVCVFPFNSNYVDRVESQHLKDSFLI